MSNAVFPTLVGQGWTVKRTPEWSTRVRQAVSGKNFRIADWSYPIWHWEVRFDLLRSDSTYLEFQTLAAFFNARYGRWDSFLYQDVDDYQSPTDQPLGTGDGTTTEFQLIRTMAGPLGTPSFIEPVTAPNTITNIKIDGSVVDPGDYSVDTDTGIVTFDTAPGDTLAVTGTFTYYWRCAFEDDKIDFDKFAVAMWSNDKVAFQSLK